MVRSPGPTFAAPLFGVEENPMARVAPFHTNSPEYPPTHRNVHHDHDDCRYGKEIKPRDRVDGEGNRPLCTECTKLGT
jgi:hypothetical protein